MPGTTFMGQANMNIDFQVYVQNLEEKEHVYRGGETEFNFGPVNICDMPTDIEECPEGELIESPVIQMRKLGYRGKYGYLMHLEFI